MALTGIAFTLAESFWPLLLIAFIGTLNPSAGDVSLFLPLEQARLAHAVADRDRTALFARYSLVGALAGAVGALCAGFPDALGGFLPIRRVSKSAVTSRIGASILLRRYPRTLRDH